MTTYVPYKCIQTVWLLRFLSGLATVSVLRYYDAALRSNLAPTFRTSIPSSSSRVSKMWPNNFGIFVC
jgi:hypothetical protein